MCLKTRLVNVVADYNALSPGCFVAVKQVEHRSYQRKRNVLSVSDRHVTKPKITFGMHTHE